jgi:cyclopropane fatty-acyl-phospholipid synthase-like methyltransferase
MKKQNYWEQMSSQVQAPEETYNKRSDVSQADASFILKYANWDSSVLDYGAGAGTVTNKLAQHVREIVAVETYPGFTQFIKNTENILVINASLENFQIRKLFDVAIATAVMQYFPEETAREMYANIYQMLRPGGKLIARNHVGLYDTVAVEKSAELQSDYFAEYRYIELEKQMLESCGFKVEIIDEVPADHNVWENTKHLYFVCTK